MKMRCVSRCQWMGDVVKVGQIVDIDERDLSLPMAKSAFVPEAGGGKAPSAKTLVAGLTRDQVELKLNMANVLVRSDMTDEELIKAYLDFAGVAVRVANGGKKPKEKKA